MNERLSSAALFFGVATVLLVPLSSVHGAGKVRFNLRVCLDGKVPEFCVLDVLVVYPWSTGTHTKFYLTSANSWANKKKYQRLLFFGT